MTAAIAEPWPFGSFCVPGTRVGLIGIDPAMTATGVSALITTVPRGINRPDVEFQSLRTITPPAAAEAQILRRLVALSNELHDHLERAIDRLLVARAADVAIVVENPLDFRIGAWAGRAQAARYKSSGVLGAAVGVALLTASTVAGRRRIGLHVYDLRTWLPRSRTGHLVHATKHETYVAGMRRTFPPLVNASEHCTMATGVALFHLRRQTERRAAAAHATGAP